MTQNLLLAERADIDHIIEAIRKIQAHPFERLDAVRDHPFPAREKPAGGDVQPEDGGPTKALTTTWTT